MGCEDGRCLQGVKKCKMRDRGVRKTKVGEVGNSGSYVADVTQNGGRFNTSATLRLLAATDLLKKPIGYALGLRNAAYTHQCEIADATWLVGRWKFCNRQC